MTAAAISWTTDEPTLNGRQRLIQQTLDFATRRFAPGDNETRIDPLARLFDPAFTEKTWFYDHSKIGELPGALHEKQIAMLNDLRPHRWCFWGNQSGKTTLGAVEVALLALGRHPLQKMGLVRTPPVVCWASALTWELWEKVLLPELLTWLPPWRVIDAPPAFKKSTRRDIIVLADNGRESRITGKAAQQGEGAYQSARVDLVWLDEEHPESVWDEMQPRLLRYRGRTIATMTPLLGFTWVHGRVYEPVRTGQSDIAKRHHFTHAGIADNPGIDPAAIEELKEELKHNPSQLESRLKGHFTRPTGAVLPWDPEKHLTKAELSPTDDKLTILRMRGAWFGALDLGKWGFHLPFGVADRDKNFLLLDEYFSQNEDVDVRARGLHAKLRYWKVPESISIPADCADPVGIQDLNDALEAIGSPYSVYPVDGNLKAIVAGIGRVENLLNRGAFKVRRGMGTDEVWRLGMNASSMGQPIMGSRWMWEASNWQYAKAKDGKVQKDEPDDASADGAHAMAATRYLVMTFFPADPPPADTRNLTREQRIAKEMEQFEKEERDEFERDPADRDRYGGVLRQ